jgi:glycosyltransferase involved in cell wall biosynthesis
MKILFLTLIVPYPPDAGPRIKTWHVLRYLSEKGYSITLLTFVRKEEEKYLPYLHQICERVIAIPIQRSKIRDVLALSKSLLGGSPFLIERDSRPAMTKTAKELLQKELFDVIHIDQVNMAQFILDNNGHHTSSKTIFDAHNATWLILERMRTTAPALMKPIIALEAKKLRNYENQLVQKVDHVLTVTENDRQLLIENPDDENLKSKFHVIPIAVNTLELRPVERKEGSNQILTIGSLNYPPNADGIRWFLRDIFPEIKRQKPEAALTIIGKNPPKDFFTLASPFGDAIQITGYVEDLTPYLEKSALMVVPVLAGGGMRVRILEAFSRGIPVVTTSIGLEGIAAENGRDVIVEDDPIEFANAVVALLDNPAEQRRLAYNARDLVTTLYDWKAVLQELDKVYQI